MKAVLLIIYILTILGIIFRERKNPTEAMLWVVVVACLPYVGLLLYLVFGSTAAIQITAYVRKKRQKGSCREPAPQVPAELLSEQDAQVARFNSTYNGSRLTSFADSSLYTTGLSHYGQLFADIKAARQCIYVEFYTIHPDRAGRALVKALTQKAAEGVRVLVLFDFIANLSTPPSMFAPLKKAGGSVIRVKPFLTHYRSHRKIVVIDHSIAYIGGMNMGEKYADLDRKKTPWRDTQVRLTGPCTRELEQYFLTDWLCAVPVRRQDSAEQLLAGLPEPEAFPRENLCQFIAGGADTNKESVKMCYLSMIRSARHRIRIQTPYFIPDASILDALKTAAAAGVQIELMIPGIRASFFLDPVTTYYCGQLLEYGAQVYKYRGYIHAKTLVVDEELCCIGSVNMDMRSLMVDDEVCGVFYANAMAREYAAIFDRDRESCDSFSYAQFQSRSRKERLAEDFFLLFAPLM